MQHNFYVFFFLFFDLWINPSKEQTSIAYWQENVVLFALSYSLHCWNFYEDLLAAYLGFTSNIMVYEQNLRLFDQFTD